MDGALGINLVWLNGQCATRFLTLIHSEHGAVEAIFQGYVVRLVTVPYALTKSYLEEWKRKLGDSDT